VGKPGREPKGHVKLTAYVPPRVKLAIQHEALDRQMTIGEVISEALARRTTIVTIK
jgi:hypothetical protein